MKKLFLLMGLMIFSSLAYATGYDDGGSGSCPSIACNLSSSTQINSKNVCLQDGTNCPSAGSGTITAVGDITSGAVGTSGAPGSYFYFKNATSGTVQLQTVAGALGTSVFSLPTGTHTAATIDGTETLTNKTLTTAILGSSTATTQASSDNSTKVATTAYVTTGITNALNGLYWKPSVGYATTANVIGTNTAGVFTYTSTGVDTIDGHTLVLNDVILFKDQTTGADNGVWTVTTAGALGVAGVLTRRSDYNAAADVQSGDAFYVLHGTANTNTTWVQTAIVNTINSDALTFSQASGPGSITSGTGITVTGNSVAINTGVTVDKTTVQTMTNKTLTSPILTTPDLGTPSALTLTNATGLPVAGITASTSTALGVGSLELGHATDTTLSRSSAGVLAVEGVVIPTAASTATFTNKTYDTAGTGNVLKVGGSPIGATEYTTANSSTALTIDFVNGAHQKVPLTGNCTFTFTAPATGISVITLKLVQDSTGSRLVTWPATVKWPGGVAPTLTTTLTTGTDLISCYYDGTNYLCNATLNVS